MKLIACPKCLAKGPLATMALPGDLWCAVIDSNGQHGEWVLS